MTLHCYVRVDSKIQNDKPPPSEAKTEKRRRHWDDVKGLEIWRKGGKIRLNGTRIEQMEVARVGGGGGSDSSVGVGFNEKNEQ